MVCGLLFEVLRFDNGFKPANSFVIAEEFCRCHNKFGIGNEIPV
jgi:hypothetical protein